MGKGECVNGELDTTLYGSPVPLIGLYIAVATLVCFFSISFDLVYGLFIQKKPFVPCKLFPMNSFTITVLAIATKIPLDLTTSMPRVEDQLSKLTGSALMCISLGFCMPSFGTMSTSERYSNLAALSMMVITMVVNVCMQMGTGVIFAFRIEHVIIMICMLVLLLLMWSSAIAFRGQKEGWGYYFGLKTFDAIENAKDVQGLRKLLERLHVVNYTGNPQTLLCETSHHHAFGLLCTLSSVVVLQAMLRSFALKKMRLCSGASDYRWSIPIMIVSQVLTIIVGTICIIYRWFSFLRHTDNEDLHANEKCFRAQRELEYLKLKSLSFSFLGKNFSNVFLIVKDSIMDVLICTQTLLYKCSSFFFGRPIYTIKTFLEFIIPFDRVFHQYTDDTDETFKEMSTSVSELKDFVISSLPDGHFGTWLSKIAMKDMLRWTNTCKRVSPTQLIQLISKHPASASKSECALFIKKLEDAGEDFLKRKYKVSCVSVLVLSEILKELMPSSLRESLMCSLDESFEIIYYVDQKTTDTPDIEDETRWALAKHVWAEWKNPNHWFRSKIISPAFKDFSLKKFEEFELELHHALGAIGDANQAIEKSLGTDFDYLFGNSGFSESLAKKHMGLIAVEFSIICKFIQEQNYGSVKDLFDFLEMLFIKMLCFTLRGLPLAIRKEIDVDDALEIGEGRMRNALNFLCKLESLWDKVEWSWSSWSSDEDEDNDDEEEEDADDDDDDDVEAIKNFGSDEIV